MGEGHLLVEFSCAHFNSPQAHACAARDAGATVRQ
jgi:hypothetical protein